MVCLLLQINEINFIEFISLYRSLSWCLYKFKNFCSHTIMASIDTLTCQGGSTNVRGSHHFTLNCRSTPSPDANPLLTVCTCYRVILTGVTLRIHKPALTFLLTEYYITFLHQDKLKDLILHVVIKLIAVFFLLPQDHHSFLAYLLFLYHLWEWNIHWSQIHYNVYLAFEQRVAFQWLTQSKNFI